jgi:hypothetical protein
VAEHKSIDVGQLAARLVAVELPMGLTLDEVIIQGEGLHLEKSPFRITLPEPGSLEVRISGDSLAAFLNEKAPGGLSGFKVRLEDGQIHVEAKATMIISMTVGAVSELRIEDESKIFVDLVRVESIGGTGIHNIVQRQLDSINPVIDAKDLPVAATFNSVKIEDNWLVIRGTIAPRSE